MSIVIAIIGTVTIGMVSMGGSMLESAKRVNTTNKLDAIETALMAYRLAYFRIPCPSDPTLTDVAANSATYGYETGAAGACTDAHGVSYTVPAPSGSSTTNVASGTSVVEGAVPVRTLGLPDEYQFDGWGRKFAYAVWTPITATGAYTSYGIAPGCGAITVENAGHGNRSIVADYALISYGPDGHGGYLKSGTRFNAGVSNVDEVANAHYSSGGADTGLYAATYVQKDYSLYAGDSDASHPFGHFVRYKERWQMQNDYDAYHPAGRPCGPGFRIDGATAGDKSGYSVAVGDVNGDGIPDLIIGAPYSGYGSGCSGDQCGSVYVVFGTSAGFPNPLALSSLNGSNGFRIDLPATPNGTYSPWAQAGTSLAVGDINGDGIQDIIIGAYQNIQRYPGSVFVVYGSSSWSRSTYTLDSGSAGSLIDGTHGFRLDGPLGSVGRLGSSLAVGDIDGDGYADIVASAFKDTTNGTDAGAVYVIYGGTTPKSGGSWPATQALSGNANGTVTFTNANNPNNGQTIVLNGVTWTFVTSGATGNQTNIGANEGATLTQLVSDLNASANGSINVATYSKSGQGGVAYLNTLTITYKTAGAAGAGYTLNGGTSGATVSGATLSGGWLANGGSTPVNGFVFYGSAAGELFGQNSPLAVADINGDGKADIIMGDVLYGNVSNNSSLFVAFGAAAGKKKDGTAWSIGQTIAADGTNIVRFYNSNWASNFAQYVAVADVNGDGLADILVQSQECVTYTSNCGTYYVIFASTNGWAASTNVNSFTGSAGISSSPSTGGVKVNLDQAGGFVSGNIVGGDINGDGIADIIYSENTNTVTTGRALVLYGTKSAWTTPMTPTFSGATGAEFDGVDASGHLGGGNSNGLAVGDLNGDGVADLVLGEYNGAPQGNANAGKTYVIFGSKSGWTSPFSLSNITSAP